MMSETKAQPYKDDTSDGTTAVKSGIPHPEEGHGVRDYRPPVDTSAADASSSTDS